MSNLIKSTAILLCYVYVFVVAFNITAFAAPKKIKKNSLKVAEQALQQDSANDIDVIRYPNTTSIFLKSTHALIIDNKTGKVLLEKKADEKIIPASLTKMMTAYLIEEKIIKQEASLDSQFLVSEKAWRMQGSKTFVPLGENIRLEDLLKGIIIQSGNDACIVAAESLSGSEENFADEMNLRAKEWGMNNTNFLNATGWPAENHYSTVRDLAILSQHVVSDHPDFYAIYSEKNFTFGKDSSGKPITQGNRNPLLYKDLGCDGIKSGHTDDGGYSLALSFIDHQRRYIAIILGLKTAQERASESVRVLSWIKDNFVSQQYYSKSDVVVAKVPVLSGIQEEVNLVIDSDVNLLTSRSSKNKVVITKDIKASIVAPIKKGDVLGKIRFDFDNQSEEFGLLAQESIEKIGFLSGIMRSISGWFSSSK